MKFAFPLVLLLAGCVALLGEPPVSIPFNETDYEWAGRPGTAVIKGQAFVRSTIGEVRTCAGREVDLSPDGPYSRARLDMIKSAPITRAMPADEPRFAQYVQKSTCNAQGNFTFNDLPPGQWVIMTAVTWEIPQRYVNIPQGGLLRQSISLGSGETKSVVLTERDIIVRR